MAKISKPILKKHNEAVKLLEKDTLDYYEKEFVFDNYHEGAGKMNNLISAHFTPRSIAHSMTFCHRYDNWVDMGAGIGRLSYAILNQNELQFRDKPFTGICIENCTEYYEVGKKLLPEMIWINGSIFDTDVVDQVTKLMKEKNFSIISNPPYGKQVKGNHPNMNYTDAIFEYKAIEMGAIYGASDGCFLIPQTSAPFRQSGVERGSVYSEDYKTKQYLKFVKQTGLHILANSGFSTEILDEDDIGWKDVSIITEIGIVEYEESEYKPKQIVIPSIMENVNNQFNLF